MSACYIHLWGFTYTAKPFKILNALIGEKLASHNVCARNFFHSFSAGGIFGVEAGAPQHLQLVADELKAIAAKSPSIDAIKQKVSCTEDKLFAIKSNIFLIHALCYIVDP